MRNDFVALALQPVANTASTSNPIGRIRRMIMSFDASCARKLVAASPVTRMLPIRAMAVTVPTAALAYFTATALACLTSVMPASAFSRPS